MTSIAAAATSASAFTASRSATKSSSRSPSASCFAAGSVGRALESLVRGGGAARAARDRATHRPCVALAAEEVTENRRGGVDDRVVASGVSLSLLHLDLVLRRRKGLTCLAEPRFVLLAQARHLCVREEVGRFLAALSERLGRLARPAVQLQLRVAGDVHRAGANELGRRGCAAETPSRSSFRSGPRSASSAHPAAGPS